MAVEIAIRPFVRSDDRSRFTCGEPALDRCLRHDAGQNQCRLHVAVTYVATLQDTPRILGFATAPLLADACRGSFAAVGVGVCIDFRTGWSMSAATVAIRRVAAHRQVGLGDFRDVRAELGSEAQSKWEAWRRKQGLVDRISDRLDEVLELL